MTNGRPLTWTDDELIQKLLEVKNKYPDIKITKALLEKETSIGRNTWQRRMSEKIEKINIQNINYKFSGLNNNINFPDIESIYKITKNKPNELVNELLKFEGIILDQHRELEELKNYKKMFEKLLKEQEITKDKLEKYKVQANFYKSAYYSLMVSSTFTYLQDVEGSIVKEHGIKQSLIKMNKELDNNLSMHQLDKFFNDIELNNKLKDKKEENFQILKDKFDL